MLIDNTRQDLYHDDKHAQYMCIAARGLDNLEDLAQSRLDMFDFYATGTAFYQIYNTMELVQPNSVMRSLTEYYVYKVDICL